jgi:glycosyltransferase involved in cell wall biosynthesis
MVVAVPACVGGRLWRYAVNEPRQPVQLDWQRRAVELVTALYRRVVWLPVRVVNEICFAFYWLVNQPRRRTHVRSVLQLSIASSKPFMISRILRAQGVKSEYFALNTDVASGILNLGWDYAIPYRMPRLKRRLLEVFYLWTVLARYDVIHSHFKTLLSHDGWELAYLKRLGKVIVFTFRGCDLRSRTLNMALYPELNCCTECEYPVGSCDTDYQRSQLQIVKKYGDKFFVTTPDLEPFFEGASHMPFIEPMIEGLDEIAPAPKTPGVFRVVTSSNHHGIDGTRFIVDAVERLKGEGRPIELVVVSKQPLREALAIYKSADVYAGKLRLGYYNNANIETMMLGIPNMTFIRDKFRQIAPDCPIINTTPDTIYERLRTYLDRPEELRAIGARGPEFVRKHHGATMLAQRLLGEYNALFASAHGRPA